MPTTDEYKERTKKAMEKYYQSKANQKFDLSGYPVDTQDILKEFCELWNCRPPANKKDKAFWIESARRLIEACAEFETELLHLVRLDFEQHMEDNQGLAPFSVGHPGALIKTVQGKAAEMRTWAEKATVVEKSAIDLFREQNDL